MATVFSIVELLELILSQLSAKQLLKARGVAKAWKTLIENSTLLRRTLFLEAAKHPIRRIEISEVP